MTLFFLRHAKTSGKYLSGWTSDPLTEEGSAQVEAYLTFLKEQKPTLDVRSIVSSDLVRARQTAEQLALLTGSPLLIDKAWRGFHIGQFAGMTQKDFMQRHAGFDVRKLAPDEAVAGGETLRHFLTRIETALRRLLNTITSQKKGGIPWWWLIAVS